ncbi:MAG: family 16 glycosylhydrolase [Bacteroidales bacterium]|nr:family 16 glycosylhydrolase [Bacteroidales bacterium]
MANLKLSLGMIPSTIKVEQAENDLIKEFEKLKAFVTSEELARYNELDARVNSSDFKQEKREIESLTYKDSEEYNREKEFGKLAKSKDIRQYFKLRDSNELKRFRDLDGSDRIKRFEELRDIVSSASFKQKFKSKEFKGSEEKRLLEDYKSLKGNSDVKFFFKFRDSKPFALYNKTEGSTRLARYEELKEYISTGEFKKSKEYLLDKKRFEKSELYLVEQEYLKLKRSDDIVWYFKVKDSDKFDVLKKREITFSDEFDGDSPDSAKWISNLYWGDKLLNDRYSHESDLHCFTEKDNLEVRSSILKIITRPDKKEGKVWNPELGGFRTKEFAFTSGIVSTGKSFRQKYGIFSAKIKLTTGAGPRHAFWMLSDKITPHIDICRTQRNKVWMDYFGSDGSAKKSSAGSKYARGFYIFTLEWKPDLLVWKINGVEVMRVTRNVPHEEMYIILSGGLDQPIHGTSAMEVDWVRVYQWKN